MVLNTSEPEDGQVKVRKSSSVYRDLLIWMFCLLILPVIIFSVYCLIKLPRNSKESPSYSSFNMTNYSETLDSDFNLFYNKLTDIEEEFISEESFGSDSLMKQVSLSNYKNSLCNDGSPASYYIRKTTSKTWIILLEGGFFCYDPLTCIQRFRNNFNLTSSKTYRKFRSGSGILSSSFKENKYYAEANQVNIPYCSSDLWIGNRRSNSNEFNFMGQQIIQDVITDLLMNFGMKESSYVLLAGVSAGGIGIALNVNKIQQQLNKEAPNVQLKAVIDSSWMLDLPYSYLCSTNNQENKDCLIRKILSDSIQYWNASLACNSKNILQCFMPEKLISNVESNYY